MGTINTNKGLYKYKDIEFISGKKKINREISKDNLLIFKKCLDGHSVKFGLIYGTLLGAIRENNFIAHDEDTDVFILFEDQKKFLDLLFELRELGLEVGRFNSKLISLVKNGEYIDIYFYRKKGIKSRECDGYVIKSDILENLEDYNFLGETFKVPKDPEKLLTLFYGKNWRIPDKKAKAHNYGIYLTIKFFIKNNFKTTFEVIRWIKRKFCI